MSEVSASSTPAEMLELFADLQPGDRVQCDHEVKVGFRKWHTTTIGTVVRKERRRHSLHFRRNTDDKVFSDMLVLRLENGNRLERPRRWQRAHACIESEVIAILNAIGSGFRTEGATGYFSIIQLTKRHPQRLSL